MSIYTSGVSHWDFTLTGIDTGYTHPHIKIL